MPYNVEFTDSNNKTPITVFENTSSTDTSLTFPGRNVTGYGQIIAENFLHLLENFASDTPPVNPVEGQFWYDSANGFVQIWDNTKWVPASGIQKGPSEPAVETSKVGELWVDTTNQQLRIFTGTRWILVGPTESSIGGFRYGPTVERIIDVDNIERFIVTFYLRDIPVVIFSKDSFSPKVIIPGFPTIKAGININVPGTESERLEFQGGILPKLFGTAESADALNVSGIAIPSGRFLRSDIVNTLEQNLVVRSNGGITLGSDGTFTISNTVNAAQIYNRSPGSSIDLQVNRDGVARTVLRVIGNRIGINKEAPDVELDVVGSADFTGTLRVRDTTDSTNLTNGSISTAGGVSVAKNIIIGDGLDVTGPTQTNDIQPKITNTYDCGTATRRWNTVRAKKIIADELEGVLVGNISGNANTATNLKNVTTFQITGDVISQPVQFDGQIGAYQKTFNTTLTANIIADKPEPFPNRSRKNDFVLTYSTTTGLRKQTRDVFVGDLGVPIGTILPFAGQTAPYGYLFCDGSEVERVRYPDLYDVIGFTYSKTRFLATTMIGGQTYIIETVGTTDFTLVGSSDNLVGTSFVATGPGTGTGTVSTTSFVGVNTFRLPDMRGRFGLGRDNMDNAGTVPTPLGNFVDAGGGPASRVTDTRAQILGEGAGQSEVGLSLTNLPEHEHTLVRTSTTFNAFRTGSGIGLINQSSPVVSVDFSNPSSSTGFVRKPDSTFPLGTPVGVMNPYLTVNYIIRSGPPQF